LFSLLRLYAGFAVVRLYEGSMKAHAAQHTGARRLFRYSGSLFRLY
jgi:hypothetical protein